MNGIINFIKQWTLPFALVTGSLTYLLFSRVPQLAPVGDAVGPVLVGLMPAVIFVMLYITFCKINLSEFRPRLWHFALQGIRNLYLRHLSYGCSSAHRDRKIRWQHSQHDGLHDYCQRVYIGYHSAFIPYG